LIWKNSLRNRRRSVLTIFSIAFSFCLLGVLVALYRALFLAPPTAGQELRVVIHHKVSITQPMPMSYLDKIRKVPGVKAAMVWQWFGGTYKDARDQKNFFARFVVDQDQFFNVRPEILVGEDQRKAFETQRTAAIASSDLAERMNWKIGDHIFLTGDIFPVNPELILVGTFSDPNTSETLFFGQEYLRQMLGTSARRDTSLAFQAQVDRAEDVPRVIQTIDDGNVNSTAPTRSESEQAFGLQFISFLGNVKVFLMSIVAAVTFTILLVSGNTMAMSVRERVREVGILKTLGYTPGVILFLVLGEAAVISVLGGAIGLGMASGLAAMIRSGPTFLNQLRTLNVTPAVQLLLLGFALFLGIASSFWPAWSASRTPILESMRDSG
jgi:putative ABC transport system permease protein